MEKRKKEGSKKHSNLTEGKTSGGFTSTKLDPVTANEMRNLSDDEIRKEYVNLVKSRQAKGRVQIVLNNYGSLMAEIYCGLVPKAAENFIELCEHKQYNDVPFHRLIKNFMVNFFLK